jgi:hypothetical protein
MECLPAIWFSNLLVKSTGQHHRCSLFGHLQAEANTIPVFPGSWSHASRQAWTWPDPVRDVVPALDHCGVATKPQPRLSAQAAEQHSRHAQRFFVLAR